VKKLLFLVLLVLGVSTAAGAAPVFRNPLPVAYGANAPGDLLTADFGGDSHDDLLLVSGGRDLTVLIANGTGPFLAPVITPVPTVGSTYPAVADVDEDGRNDVVLSDWSTHAISVMLGNGDGTFSIGPAFTADRVPGPLAIADFNGDHHLDVAVASQDDHSAQNTVAVHLGDGTGHFASGMSIEVGDYAWMLSVAELNGDGKADLVVGQAYETRLLTGNGNGGFTLGASMPGGGAALGDFNHDGKADVALTRGSTTIDVYVGNGDGTVGNPLSYPTGGTRSITPVDLDGDGNLDLLATSQSASVVVVLRGNPNGTFGTAGQWLSGPGTSDLAVGDFDRDGKLDFVTSDVYAEGKALSFVRGNGDGTFQTASRSIHTAPSALLSVYGLHPAGGVAADMNHDQKPDVVVVQRRANFNTYEVGVLLNDGSGKLAAPILTDPVDLNAPAQLAVGDVNGDGNGDVVLLTTEFTPRAITLLGNGLGGFGAPISRTVTSGQLLLGQFNADSNLDLLIASGALATIYPGNGNGSFGAAIQSEINAWNVMAGDLNGDGKDDYVSSFIGSIHALVNDGTGHFVNHTISVRQVLAAALADFNGDGKLDVLLTNYDGTELQFGNGDGTFGAPVVFRISHLPHYPLPGPVVTGDFDGDGKVDAAFGTSVYLSNGDGTFRARARFRTWNVNATSVADMDGNGSPDLVALKSDPDDVNVLLTRTTADPTAPSSLALSASSSVAQYSEWVTFTATVTGGAVPRTGSVLFAMDNVPVALVPVDADGKAAFMQGFATGSFTVTATYAGDENYLSSTASTGLTVTKAETIALISGGPSPRSYGNPVTIMASVNGGQGSGLAFPTGPLTFRDGATPLTLTLTNGSATITTLSVGSHVISVDYAGDANYEASTASYTQVISKPVPYVGVEPTPAEGIVAGQAVTFKVDMLKTHLVTSDVTGTITFFVDDVPRFTLPLADGKTSFQSSFTWGGHNISVSYSGNDTWAASSSNFPVQVHIGPWGTPLVMKAVADGTSLNLQWAQVLGGTSYTIWRKKSLIDGWEPIATQDPTATGMSGSIDAGKTWLFAVTATDANGNVSPMSAPDLATAIHFTDPTLVPLVTPVKSKHLQELRTAVASVRTFAGMSAASYTNPVLLALPIRATDIQELRNDLAAARTAIGLPAIAWTDATLTPSTTKVRAAHVTQLRDGVN
jgi:hypothetical protein